MAINFRHEKENGVDYWMSDIANIAVSAGGSIILGMKHVSMSLEQCCLLLGALEQARQVASKRLTSKQMSQDGGSAALEGSGKQHVIR